MTTTATTPRPITFQLVAPGRWVNHETGVELARAEGGWRWLVTVPTQEGHRPLVVRDNLVAARRYGKLIAVPEARKAIADAVTTAEDMLR